MKSSNARKLPRQMGEQIIDVNDYQSNIVFQAVTKNFSIDENNRIEGIYFEAEYPVPPGKEIYINVSPFTIFLNGTLTFNGFARAVWCSQKKSEDARPIFEVGAHCITNACSFCKNNISEIGVDCGDMCLCGDCAKHLVHIPASLFKRNLERFMMVNVI